jgi:hypothetical protein
MAPRTGSTRAAQLTSSGLGTHFTSPWKLRDKRKTQTLVNVPGHKTKHRHLLTKMASLLAGPAKPEETSPIQPDMQIDTAVLEEDSNDVWEDVPAPHDNSSPQPASQSTPSRRTQPDITSTRLYDNWKSVIPTLVAVQLDYTARTLGVPLE